MPPQGSKKRKLLLIQTRSPDKIVYTYGVGILSGDDTCSDSSQQSNTNMEDSIASVESILQYRFKNKNLLEEALTHSSYIQSSSYERLEFVGDAALGIAITNHLYLAYPDADPGVLSRLRSFNISTEKLARVAVRHGFHKFVRHNAPNLSDKVREFVMAVEEEEEMVVHGGKVRAPKVLADIVESVAAAVYVDCGFNLTKLWMTISKILEPLVLLEDLEKQPQPITMLFEICQKNGKQVYFKQWRKGQKSIASVYVDDRFVVSASSENKENAKLHAAEAALMKLTGSKSANLTGPVADVDFSETTEIEGAKQKVHEICKRNNWPKPTYNLEQEFGPAHDKRYISSITVEAPDTVFSLTGHEKPRVKDAENSAASMMFHALREIGYTRA